MSSGKALWWVAALLLLAGCVQVVEKGGGEATPAEKVVAPSVDREPIKRPEAPAPKPAPTPKPGPEKEPANEEPPEPENVEPAPQETVDSVEPELSEEEPAPNEPPAEEGAGEQGKPLGRELEVTLNKSGFYPPQMVVASGDLLRLTVNVVDDGWGNGYDVVVEGYGTLEHLRKGDRKTVEFTLDLPGTYLLRCEGYCAAGTHKTGQIRAY